MPVDALSVSGHVELPPHTCAERGEALEDALPAKEVKRPRRGEANHVPDIPTGETPDNLENERASLLSKVKK